MAGPRRLEKAILTAAIAVMTLTVTQSVVLCSAAGTSLLVPTRRPQGAEGVALARCWG